LDSSGVVLTLDVWCADALSAVALKCHLLEQATKRFALEEIGISLPQMTVVLKNDRHVNGKLAAELKRQQPPVSDRTVAALLKAAGYSLQTNRKTREGSAHEDRNAQV
jgi:small-conductance mechanosensitive channel